MSKHTPEPWFANGEIVTTAKENGKFIAEARTEDLAKRIAADHNACAWMEDPQAEIDGLKFKVESLQKISSEKTNRAVELEAEIQQLRTERDELMKKGLADVMVSIGDGMNSIIAERDAYKSALEQIARMPKSECYQQGDESMLAESTFNRMKDVA